VPGLSTFSTTSLLLPRSTAACTWQAATHKRVSRLCVEGVQSGWQLEPSKHNPAALYSPAL
jgi:hypothetical protein